ncbi:hypothetical protein J6590_024652 [Homalodisca vitripennis]|nr:hypothetical protein J6590_024652 [Homalodisca vitripennis]
MVVTFIRSTALSVRQRQNSSSPHHTLRAARSRTRELVCQGESWNSDDTGQTGTFSWNQSCHSHQLAAAEKMRHFRGSVSQLDAATRAICPPLEPHHQIASVTHIVTPHPIWKVHSFSLRALSYRPPLFLNL